MSIWASAGIGILFGIIFGLFVEIVSSDDIV